VDIEYDLLKEVVTLQKKFAEAGFLDEARLLAKLAYEFNDQHLIIASPE